MIQVERTIMAKTRLQYANLFVDDFIKTVGTAPPLKARLVDRGTNDPIVNVGVSFRIHGVTYTRYTDSNGYASLNINLDVGVYPTVVSFSGTDTYGVTYKEVSKEVTVTVSDKYLSLIDCAGLDKTEGSAPPLVCRLTDEIGTVLSGKTVKFTINGVDYNKTTDSNGYASLNINLGVGAYTATMYFAGDSTHLSATKTATVRVIAKPRVQLLVDNHTKTWNEPGPLIVQLLDLSSNPITSAVVQFTINGVTYDRTTDVGGYTHLNINLDPGVYPCTVTYNGDSTYGKTTKKVTVTVKSDTWIDAPSFGKVYGTADAYQCAVYDPWNRLRTSVELTINGVTYTRSSQEDGLIKLNINLQPGEYPIDIKFNGDGLHNPSTRSALIRVEPPIQQLTYRRSDGVVQPETNQGNTRTRIYTGSIDASVAKEKNIQYTLLGEWINRLETTEQGLARKWTSYEINETDPRVKTAKFTTPTYLDLTQGLTFVYIASPFHENFGGRILDVDFDKNTGLYTYQCQDGRRQYIGKSRTSIKEVRVYDILESQLANIAMTKGYTIPISQADRDNCASLLSGLHPIDHYKIKNSPIMTPDNYMERKITILSYDRIIDKIMNIAHTDGQAVDVYFTPDMICHIDPIDLDTWLNTGIRLTHQDLVSYKYGFDTTNIISGVLVKDPKQTIQYGDWFDLTFYFGLNQAIVDPVTSQVQSEGSGSSSSTGTNNVSTGIMSGKKTFDVGQDSGIVTDYRLDVINALRQKGHTVNDLGVGDSVVQNNGRKSSSKGHIGVFICNGICCGTHWDFVYGMRQGYYHYDHVIFTWVRGDIEMNRKQSRAHDDNFTPSGAIDTSITRQQFFDKNSDKVSDVNLWPEGNNSAPLSRADWQKQVNALVNGQFNNASGSTATNTNSSSSDTQTQTTTVIDEAATYNKALDEVTKSVRDLLSFSIRVPLNSPVFKKLHTNSMMWTQLPKEFKLGNLENIFKIMGSWKASGYGVPYLENRWYIEAVKIKGDENGVFADITLNPFPSSQSSFKNAVRQYAEAYDQAFNQQNQSSSNSSSNNGVGEPKLGNDCTDTNSMRAMSGGVYGNSGHGKNFDSAAQKGYAVKGANYYNWARQYNDVISLLKAIAKICNPNTYNGYYNNRTCPQKAFNTSAWKINCYDACRLVKVCCDSAGFPCVIITGSIYDDGHGWNAVKYNGKWYTFDCFYTSKTKGAEGTNSIRSVW